MIWIGLIVGVASVALRRTVEKGYGGGPENPDH